MQIYVQKSKMYKKYLLVFYRYMIPLQLQQKYNNVISDSKNSYVEKIDQTMYVSSLLVYFKKFICNNINDIDEIITKETKNLHF